VRTCSQRRPEADEFPSYPFPHPLFRSASDALRVTYAESKGRHVIASRDVDVGECLIDEEAATHSTFLNKSLSHCYACTRHVVSPQPCTQCSAVVFCGVRCRTISEQRYFWGLLTRKSFFGEARPEARFFLL
jgi:hypothetical protein